MSQTLTVNYFNKSNYNSWSIITQINLFQNFIGLLFFFLYLDFDLINKSDHRKKMTRKLPEQMTDSLSINNNPQQNSQNSDCSDLDEPITPVIRYINIFKSIEM